MPTRLPRAARSHRESVGLRVPNSPERQFAVLARGPSIRCTCFDLKASEESLRSSLRSGPLSRESKSEDRTWRAPIPWTTSLTQRAHAGARWRGACRARTRRPRRRSARVTSLAARLRGIGPNRGDSARGPRLAKACPDTIAGASRPGLRPSQLASSAIEPASGRPAVVSPVAPRRAHRGGFGDILCASYESVLGRRSR